MRWNHASAGVFNAGLGFGAAAYHDIIRAFMPAPAGELRAGNALAFPREVDSINMRRRTRMVELTAAARVAVRCWALTSRCWGGHSA